jgi:hypothetical protein
LREGSSAQRNGDERAINQISPRESVRRQSGSMGSWGWRTHLPGDCGAGEEMVFVEEEETRPRRRRGASRERRQPHPPEVPHPSLSAAALLAGDEDDRQGGHSPRFAICILNEWAGYKEDIQWASKHSA